MRKFILINWLLLAFASLLVGIYIVIFEEFLRDKGYLYFVLAVVFAAVYYFQKKKV